MGMKVLYFQDRYLNQMLLRVRNMEFRRERLEQEIMNDFHKFKFDFRSSWIERDDFAYIFLVFVDRRLRNIQNLI